MELCSVGLDGAVKFWDVRTRGCVNEVKGLGEAITLAWHPDGENVIVGNKVRIDRYLWHEALTNHLSVRQTLYIGSYTAFTDLISSTRRSDQPDCLRLGREESLCLYRRRPGQVSNLSRTGTRIRKP